MDAAHLIFLTRSRFAPASRRGVLTGLTGGLLAALPFGWGVDHAEARKNRKRKNRKRKTRRDKKDKTRVTATCPGSDRFGLATDNGDQRLAQTFPARVSGPLVTARLALDKDEDSAGDFVLRLSPVDGAGAPTNEVLAETTVANAKVPDGGGNITFAFADPAAVVAGNTYALVLTRPGGDRIQWGGDVEDPCTGQQAFFSASQTAPFEPTLGVNDLDFTAFVRR